MSSSKFNPIKAKNPVSFHRPLIYPQNEQKTYTKRPNLTSTSRLLIVIDEPWSTPFASQTWSLHFTHRALPPSFFRIKIPISAL
ncbi:hypothetical protein L1887_33399 [Cichorium endivia]|nr:hypothetical protein L1887_33399 [Cichorium endivia]